MRASYPDAPDFVRGHHLLHRGPGLRVLHPNRPYRVRGAVVEPERLGRAQRGLEDLGEGGAVIPPAHPLWMGNRDG